MKVAAIYTRKSKFTGKGESIEQQVNSCKEYLKRLAVEEYIVYEDEGFSGKSIDRPNFKQMMRDAADKKFNILICYRLDRVSRNVADFSVLITKLEKLNIGFISVSEQFDTTSPLGRAMMFMSSVFAQLERETISERIKDNMLELSKSGRWLGGTTPIGYKSEKVEYTDENGKTRSYFKLICVPEELKIVKDIFNKYLDYKSLSQVEKYLLTNNIKTRNNKDWSKSKISYVLSNPIYVKTTQTVTDYLEEKEINVFGEPDGIHGMISYNKTKEKTGSKLREYKYWIYAISSAEGIISDQNWLEVQRTLMHNRDKAPRLGKAHNALLSGLIRCSYCGSYMRVKSGGISKDTGKRKYFYVCSLKYDSGHTRCDNPNADTDILDKGILHELKEICCDSGLLVERLKQYEKEMKDYIPESEISSLNLTISQNILSIENLLNNLSLTSDEATSKIILNKIEEINRQKSEYEKRLKKLQEGETEVQQYVLNLDSLNQSYFRFSNMIDYATHEEKQLLISSVVKRILWDGKEKKVKLELVGSVS